MYIIFVFNNWNHSI